VSRWGYAVAVDELEIGLTAVVAPPRRPDGVVAAPSASGPTFRIPADRLPALIEAVMIDAVMTAASAASRRLGWHGLPAAADDRPAPGPGQRTWSGLTAPVGPVSLILQTVARRHPLRPQVRHVHQHPVGMDHDRSA